MKKIEPLQPFEISDSVLPATKAFQDRLEAFDANTIPALEEAHERLVHTISSDKTPRVLFGECLITIRLRGAHHNASDGDANRIARRHVADYRASGHEIISATFSNGAEEDLASTPKEIP